MYRVPTVKADAKLGTRDTDDPGAVPAPVGRQVTSDKDTGACPEGAGARLVGCRRASLGGKRVTDF